MKLTAKWAQALDQIDMAFQAIIDIRSGEILAYESLLRNYAQAGFASIDAFFDQAHEEGVLFSVDMALRQKTLNKFKQICCDGAIKLFYNIDNRVIDMPDYQSGKTIELLDSVELPQGCITFEISEKHKFDDYADAKKTIDIYRSQGFSIALDDFGKGYSGLELLYQADPDYVKVDRFFITNIENDPKKQHLLGMIVQSSKVLGFKVLAEGIETQEELLICQSLGCDYAQGYYIEYPTVDLSAMKKEFSYLVAPVEERQRSVVRRGTQSSRPLQSVSAGAGVLG